MLALVESQCMNDELIPRVATGLGGGMGGEHELVCGALSGAALAAGVFLGRDRPPEPDAARPKAYKLTDEVIVAFRQKFGTVFCYELIGQAIGVPPRDPRWVELYKAAGVRETCANFVRFAVERWLDLFPLFLDVDFAYRR